VSNKTTLCCAHLTTTTTTTTTNNNNNNNYEQQSKSQFTHMQARSNAPPYDLRDKNFALQCCEYFPLQLVRVLTLLLPPPPPPPLALVHAQSVPQSSVLGAHASANRFSCLINITNHLYNNFVHFVK
jgi:hypothetical protein